MDTPVKILRIITRLNIGGPAQQAVLLTDHVNPTRFQSVLVSGRPTPTEGDLGHLARARGIRWIVVPALRRAIHPWYDLIAFLTLLRVMWREQPTIIHTHMAKAGTLGRLAGICYRLTHPHRRLLVIHTFHGHIFHSYFGQWASRVFMAIERWLARRTDCLIAVSDAIKTELLHYRIGRAEQIRVMPVGLALDAFLAVDPPSSNGSPCCIGIVGRLVPVKNHQLFLEAVSRLRTLALPASWRCVIIGDGELRQSLEREVDRRGLRDLVAFQGWCLDVPAMYRAITCVCLTSLNEGTPLSLIEAMAAARPVVATDVGGVRDLLGEPWPEQPQPRFQQRERGLLVRSGDAEGLAEALAWLAHRPDLQRQLGEAGRQFIRRHFTAGRLVRDIETLYETLCACSTTTYHAAANLDIIERARAPEEHPTCRP